MAPTVEISETVTGEHLLVFGGIIHGFARVEGLMIATMAALSKTDVRVMAIVMRPLGYEQKRDVLYSYFVLFETKSEFQTPIRNFLDEIHQYAAIRNHIAHSYWVPGKRPSSIKPASLKVRGGKGKITGIDKDEPDYLALEFARIGDKIRMIHNSLLVFLRSQNFLSDIDENMLQTMSETSESDGAQAK